MGNKELIESTFNKLQKEYASISIIANSVGAYFTMLTLQSRNVEKAFFISPILYIEKLILNMMVQADVTEKELKKQQEIETDFGKTLSGDCLTFVRNNPIVWDIPINILYVENDNMTSRETVDKFLSHNLYY